MDRDDIYRAVASHALWKAKLRRAIDTESSTLSVEDVLDPDQCDFGRWLRSLTPDPTYAEHREHVRAVHARFHQVAASAVELIASGQKAAAERALDPGSEFCRLTTELTRLMLAWSQAERVVR